MTQQLTRKQAVLWQQKLFGVGAGSTLTEVCMNLRAGVNGSADEWEAPFVAQAAAMLRARLATWEPSGPREKRLDDAVRELVAATLAEVESYAWWKGGECTSGA